MGSLMLITTMAAGTAAMAEWAKRQALAAEARQKAMEVNIALDQAQDMQPITADGKSYGAIHVQMPRDGRGFMAHLDGLLVQHDQQGILQHASGQMLLDEPLSLEPGFYVLRAR